MGRVRGQTKAFIQQQSLGSYTNIRTGVLHARQVGGRHHQVALGGLVLEGALPRLALVRLLGRPLLVQEQGEVVVRERGFRAGLIFFLVIRCR